MTDEQQPQQQPQSDSNGMAIAALIVGLLAAVIALIPLLGFISWLLGPVAIVLGVIGMQKQSGKGMAIAGIAGGVVAIIICIFWLMAFRGIAMWGEEVSEQLQEQVEAEELVREAAEAAKRQRQ